MPASARPTAHVNLAQYYIAQHSKPFCDYQDGTSIQDKLPLFRRFGPFLPTQLILFRCCGLDFAKCNHLMKYGLWQVRLSFNQLDSDNSTMAQRSSVIAQETEDGISSKTKRVYRALVNSLPWRRGSGVGSEHDQSLAKEGVLPTGSDSIAERRSEPPPDRGSLDDKAVPTADGDINAQKQEDGAPDVDTSLAPPPAKDRDLWDEAWKSNDLDEEARNRLQRPWNHFSDTTQSLLEVPKRDKNAKRRDKPTQGGLRGENTTKTSDYNQCVDDVIHGLQFRQEEYPTQWEGSKDTAKKILTSVLTIKKIIDAGVAFDPTGYGASAWAVVSFGLTVGL